MTCYQCGQLYDDQFAHCPHCGASQVPVENNDRPSFWLSLLGFCFPLVGLILFFALLKNKPKKSRSAGFGALISVILSIVVPIILTILCVALGIGGIFLARTQEAEVRPSATNGYYADYREPDSDIDFSIVTIAPDDYISIDPDFYP